jgi:predicted membrane channel-forming protein YqfA (hemolysin III family)
MPFLRFLFSTKGVGWKKALQGYLLCEKCGSTLRKRSRSLSFRFLLVTSFFILLFVIEALALTQLVAFLGFTLTTVVYVVTILATGFAGSFLEWKYFESELVQSGNAA